MKKIFIIFISALLICLVLANEDYYRILEIDKDATESDIKKAFRRLSVKYHPDKNPGDQESARRYLEVNKAYEVLNDQEKKQLYDLYGEEGLTRQDVDMFGNRKTQKGPNAKQELSVTLEELYNGAQKEYTINRNVICPVCRGSGSKDGKLKVCKFCNGQGVRMQTMSMGIGFNVQMQVPCDRCGGKGKVSAGNCPSCHGNRVVPKSKVLKIIIEKGMQDGREIVFPRESEQHPDYLPGDVIFTLRLQSHVLFKRIGDNLYTEMKISLKDAILGFKKSIKHLDDHFTEIENKEIVQPFSVKVMKEEGMPLHNFPSQKGDLHVKFIIRLPQKLNDNDKAILKKLFALNK